MHKSRTIDTYKIYLYLTSLKYKMTFLEKELWNKIKQNDKKAFESVFDRFYGSLSLYAFGIVKDSEAAKEIVTDVFVKIWQIRHNIEITHGLKPYLFRSTSNACINYLHSANTLRQKDTIELTDKIKELVADNDENIIDKLSLDEVERDVMDAINHLPRQCREIFCKSRFDLLSYDEISEILNISVNTVKTQISRALDSLREQLKQYL